MKYIKNFESVNLFENSDKIEMLDNFDLGGIYDKADSLIKGEEYIIHKNKRDDYKGWWIISGKYKNKDGSIDRYALSFSPKEFKIISNIAKKVGKVDW